MSGRFHIDVAAEPTEIGLVRRAVALFLRVSGWPDAGAEQVVFAVGEAVSNSVEHAFRGFAVGRVGVDLELDAAGLLVTVNDDGRWREPGHSGLRHNGLPLIRAMVDDLVVESDAAGTRAVMRIARG